MSKGLSPQRVREIQQENETRNKEQVIADINSDLTASYQEGQDYISKNTFASKYHDAIREAFQDGWTVSFPGNSVRLSPKP